MTREAYFKFSNHIGQASRASSRQKWWGATHVSPAKMVQLGEGAIGRGKIKNRLAPFPHRSTNLVEKHLLADKKLKRHKKKTQNILLDTRPPPPPSPLIKTFWCPCHDIGIFIEILEIKGDSPM